MSQNKHTTDVGVKREKARILRRIIGIVLIIVVIVLIAAVILVGIRIQKDSEAASEDQYADSYQEVLNIYYSSILNADGQAMANILAPADYWTYYLSAYDKSEDDVIDYYTEFCQGIVEDWESTYGANITLSYQIDGQSTPSEDGLEEWDEMMESIVGSDALDIKEAVTLQVELTVSGDNSSEVLTYYPTIVQMGDSWYMLSEDDADLQGT